MHLQSPFPIKGQCFTMINKKTTEIWMEFDNAYKGEGEAALSGKEELENLLLWLERWTNEKRLQQEKQPKERQKMFPLSLKVKTQEGPALARVSVYQKQGRLEDAIPILRGITDEEGCIVFYLEKGDYRIRVNIGPSYQIWEKEIYLPQDAQNLLTVEMALLGLPEPGWLSGDLHHHSIYSSPVYGGTDAVIETPEQVRQSLQAYGCEFGALSDHHNILNHKQWQQEKCQKFTPLLSKEISTSNGHVNALGAIKDVIYHIPCEDQRSPQYLKKEFIRVTHSIRKNGGLAQLNHPFDTSKSTSWPQEFHDIAGCFDAIEICNGAHPMLKGNGNGKAVAWWLTLCQSGCIMTGTGGSDTHNIQADSFDKDLRGICQILSDIEQFNDQLPQGIREETTILKAMETRSLPYFLEWAAEKLGSACVRTCVKIAENQLGQQAQEDLPQTIQRAILNGNCMVTNGPMLYVQIYSMGTSQQPSMSSQTTVPPIITINIRILSQERPGNLVFYLSDGRRIEQEITNACQKTPWEYYLSVKEIPAGKAEWVVCALETEQAYQAIVNPVFL